MLLRLLAIAPRAALARLDALEAVLHAVLLRKVHLAVACRTVGAFADRRIVGVRALVEDELVAVVAIDARGAAEAEAVAVLVDALRGAADAGGRVGVRGAAADE